jgi:hypothetical protein
MKKKNNNNNTKNNNSMGLNVAQGIEDVWKLDVVKHRPISAHLQKL